jgi:DNA replication protein DnaC
VPLALLSARCETNKLTRRLRSAKLRYAASLEEVDFKYPRAIDREQVLSLETAAGSRAGTTF